MDRQKLPIYHTSQRVQIETVHKQIVNLLIVFYKTFLSKIKKASHLSTLMIPTQKENSGWEINLQTVQQQQNFDRKGTSIYKITQKQVLGVFRVASHFQYLQ